MTVHGANTLSVIQRFALLPKLFQIENVIADVCEFSYQMHARLGTMESCFGKLPCVLASKVKALNRTKTSSAYYCPPVIVLPEKYLLINLIAGWRIFCNDSRNKLCTVNTSNELR